MNNSKNKYLEQNIDRLDVEIKMFLFIYIIQQKIIMFKEI